MIINTSTSVNDVYCAPRDKGPAEDTDKNVDEIAVILVLCQEGWENEMKLTDTCETWETEIERKQDKKQNEKKVKRQKDKKDKVTKV